MRYKVVVWKGGLVRATYKTDDPAKVNFFVKRLKKEAEKIEVFERGSLERKIFNWDK